MASNKNTYELIQLQTDKDGEELSKIILESSNIDLFKTVLPKSLAFINKQHDHCFSKTYLESACSSGKAEFVKELLNHGADPNIVNTHYSRAALHFAVERGDPTIVECMLSSQKTDIDLNISGNTPLNILIKKLHHDTNSVENYVKCAKLLLQHGANPNIPDMNGRRPIHIAAEKEYIELIEVILNESKIPVEIDIEVDDETTREIINENKLYKGKLPEVVTHHTTIEDLFVYLNSYDETKFEETLQILKSNENFNINDCSSIKKTLLQVAADRGLEHTVKLLTQEKCDVNLTAKGDTRLPIEIACDNGYFKIMNILLEQPNIKISDNLLHIAIANSNKDPFNSNVDFKRCARILLDNKKININSQNDKKNTALHFAARNSDHECALELLRRGASISIKNCLDEMPLADLQARTLETYLDECIDTNKRRCTDIDYKIIFNYDLLAPHSNNQLHNTDEQTEVHIYENNNENDPFYNRLEHDIVPETDTLMYMSKNPELKKLLKHPVITSFIFLKWHRIRGLFYTNLAFYVIFCALLISYILFTYGQEATNNTYNTILTIFLILFTILLAIRETFQMFISFKKYIFNFENWIEISLILITISILTHEPKESIRQQLSAIAILLLAAELVLLVGQHPALSTNIVMLRTVTWNFFKFLLWYSILIIAFALSFYTLFRGNKPKPKPIPMDAIETTTDLIQTEKEEENDEDEENNFFVDPGMSIFKTIVMLTGEFDASDINFNSFPIISHLIFILFVFLIAIVLFNLLNGLAVSDTQMIKNDAQLVGLIQRICLISYFERLLLSKQSPIPKVMGLFNCNNIITRLICLFPYQLPENKVYVKVNLCGKIECTEEPNDCEDTNCFCKHFEMDKQVLKSAKNLIIEKNTVNENTEMIQLMSKYKEQLNKIEEKLELLLRPQNFTH